VIFKHGLLVLFVGLWLFGLSDQIHSWDLTAKYLAISALMVAVAVL